MDLASLRHGHAVAGLATACGTPRNHPFIAIFIGGATALHQADKGISFVIFFESLYLVDNRIAP